MMKKYKTWVEISQEAIYHNLQLFKQLIGDRVQLWSVVKSNAYGHGLVDYSLIADKAGTEGFCVDSVLEGLTLRRAGIQKPILVLGPTLAPHLLDQAAANNITVTASNESSLNLLLAKIQEGPKTPFFHLKIDTGMRRQGFYLSDIEKIAGNLGSKARKFCSGIYSHFASAKDINKNESTERQFAEFLKAAAILEKGGFRDLTKHIAATGGTLMDKKYHLDAVRIGIGGYGRWPSLELKNQLQLDLRPVLSWKTLISEIKSFKKGDYFGYDLSRQAQNDGKLAILPIGYWHGLDRGLSNCGEVIINNQRASILGKVSMDLTIVDVTNIDCRLGDEAEIPIEETANRLKTINYEIVTRINPLIKRIIVK